MSTVTNVLTFLHVLCAIVGFGWVLLVGIQFKRAGDIKGPEGAELFGSAAKVTKVATIFIYLTGAFGLAAALTITGAFKMMWLNISMLVYVVALGISIGLLQPAERKLHRLFQQSLETPSAAVGAEIDALGKRTGMYSGILDLFFVILLFLMIFKVPS